MFRLAAALSVLCLVAGELDHNDDRVVNGRTAMINEFPYQCSIQQQTNHFCGGSVLNENYILTAAHCLIDILQYTALLTVRCGTTTWSQGGVQKNVESAKIHPKYDPKSMQYDVGFLKLFQKIIFSAVIKPVQLLKTHLRSGSPVVVSGWGQTSDTNTQLPMFLQALVMKYLTGNDCAARGFGPQIKKTMICAAGPAQDACRGDSGGPLNIPGTMTQVGIVSWGVRCADAGMPGVYVDIADEEIYSFIEKHVGRLF